MDVVGIVSNHPRETYSNLDFGDIPFHYLPVTRQTKMEQEAQVWETVKSARADLVVPEGEREQELVVYVKTRDGELRRVSVLSVRFVPMTGRAQDKK